MICINCSVETLNPKFCSRSCAATYNNKFYPKRTHENNCIDCNKPINNKNIRCRKCNIAYRLLESGKITKGELKTKRETYQNWRSSITRHANRIYALSDKPKKCFKCGYHKFYDVCHITAVKDFPDTATIEQINHIDNLVALCPNHHREFDHINSLSGDLNFFNLFM